jgi:hypothetical protein
MSPPPRDGVEARLLVRHPDEVWSDEFRDEVRRDQRFEGSLLRREILVLLLIAGIILLRILAG